MTMSEPPPSRSSSRRSNRRRGSSAASTSSINSEWESRETFDYVEDNSISEWLKCSICLCPFVSPVVSPTCSHTFCYSCIKHALRHGNSDENTTRMRVGPSSDLDQDEDLKPSSTCPSCRAPAMLSAFEPAQPIIRHMLEALLVKCSNSRRGCTATTQRQFLETHVLKDCGYTYLGEYSEEPRPHAETAKRGRKGKARCGCGERVMKKDLEAHKKIGCSAKWVNCEACKESFREPDLPAHTETCPEWTIKCLHCGCLMIRSEVESHEQSCPMRLVDCPHGQWGCNWTGELQSLGQRSSSLSSSSVLAPDSHLSSCRYEVLSPLLATLSRQFADLRGENATLRARMDHMEVERDALLDSVEACRASLGNFLLSEEGNRNPVTMIDGTSRVTERTTIWLNPDPIPNFARSQSFPMASTSAPASTSTRHFTTDAISNESREQDSLPVRADSHGPLSELPAPSTSTSDAPFRNRSSTIETSASRSRTSSTPQSARPISSTLSSTLSSIQSSINSLNSARLDLERRNHEEHLAFMNTGFEVGRAHEELASLRHGLHAVRMQMHSVSIGLPREDVKADHSGGIERQPT